MIIKYLFVLIALSCVSISQAQTTVPPSAVTLAPVVVQESRANLLGIADSSSEGFAGAKQLQLRPLLRPAEVLELVPGLIATQHSGDGKANQYFLRGFNLDHGTDFATYVDGMPVNLRTHAHGHGYTDLNFLIPEFVSSVRYRKGSYFAEDGDFSSAGSARIALKQKLIPSFAKVEVGKNQFLRWVGGHSIDSTWGTILIGVESQYANGVWEVPQRYRKTNLLLKHANTVANDSWSFSLMNYSAGWTATDQIPLRAVTESTIGRFGSLDPTTGGNSNRQSVAANWTRRFDNSRIQLNGYAIRSSLDLFSNFTYYTRGCSEDSEVSTLPPDCGDARPRDQFEQVDRRVVVGGELSFQENHSLLQAESSSVAGVQVRTDRIGKVGLYETTARERETTLREDRVRESSVGLFFQNSTRWNSWFRTQVGLRADQFSFAVTPLLSHRTRKQTNFISSPKVSATIGPWQKTELSLNWGRGFHSNDARGVTSEDDPATALVKSRGSEIGLRTSVLLGFQSTLTLWRLALDSELLFVGDAGTTEASRPSKRQGIEWTNTWRPLETFDARGIEANWLTIDADLSFSKARFRDGTSADNQIPGSPDTVASIGVSADNKGAWYSGLRVRYFGKRPLVEDGSVKSAANVMTNFKVGYRFGKHWSAELDVINAFNKKANDIEYFYGSRLRSEPAFNESSNKGDLHFHPSEPRTARLVVKLNF